VNGEEVHNLTLLGKIVKANDSSTSLMYTIDDGTGTCEVKIWVDADDADGQNQNKAEWKVGAYVRVYGHLRAFQGQRGVIAFNMRPVTDFNEITYHFLEVVYCNSHNASRAATAGAAPATAAMGGDSAYAAPSAGAPAAAMPAAGGSANDQVFAIFNGPQGHGESGVRVDDVVTQLNGRFTEAQVRESVEHLVNEGHLYSTIDDDHFKSTLL
jgi:replication factor A2